VREWNIVTVACRCKSKNAMVIPLSGPAHKKTARRPSSESRGDVEQLDDPAGVHGLSPALVQLLSLPALPDESIDVLRRVNRIEHYCGRRFASATATE